MATQTWTDPVLSDSIKVKDTHFEELMEAINDWEEAYADQLGMVEETNWEQSISQYGEDIDVSAFTEVDPNAHISKTSSVVTITGLVANEEAYVYKDYGVSGPFDREYFSKNYEHLVEFKITAQANTSLVCLWSLQNNIESIQTLKDNSHYANSVYVYQTGGVRSLVLSEINPSAGATKQYTDAMNGVALDTTYYLKITRNEQAGAFGTIYCYVYSDSERTTLIDTLSIALHDSFRNYRYLFATNSYNLGTESGAVTGTISNLQIPPALISADTVNQMQNALDDLAALPDDGGGVMPNLPWTSAVEDTTIIIGGDVTDHVDQLRDNMEYFQDNNCYLCHTCDNYSACSCNNACYSYATCTSCNNSCYNYSCSCNSACYGYSSCSCNNTCYQETKSGCTCDNVCYGYSSCSSCNSTCYGRTCSVCYSSCYLYSACSCDQSCHGYTCSKCDISDYEYPWS